MRVIHCTQKLLKELDYNSNKSNIETINRKGLGNWYANIFLIERRKCLLFTNEKSLYSFLIAGIKKDNIKNITAEFQQHLKRNLEFESIEQPIVNRITEEYTEVLFMKTNNRSVLGSMTDFKWAYEVSIQMDGGLDQVDILQLNWRINQTPMKAIGYKYPIEVLNNILQETYY